MGVLELRAVSKEFAGPPKVRAIRDCSFVIEDGDLATFQGPSGSGKSTLLQIMALLDRPTEGSVCLNGVDTTNLNENARTRMRGSNVGLVFQQFHLMHHRSVEANVMLAGLYSGIPEAERLSRATAAISRVGLDGRQHQRVATLSGGEQQRVAIARALASEPEILLCDEPTGNLDSERSAAIISLLKGLNEDGRTLIIVSHDPGVVAIGRRQFSVLDGQVSEK